MQAETLNTKIYHEETQKLSFDLLASVRMAQFDLTVHGQVLPETMQRIYDEELTYIAEAIDRPISTEFTLRQEKGDLVFFDRGEWRPYIGTLISGLSAAKNDAAKDYRKQFLVERASNDLAIGYKMARLKTGEAISWYSDYPIEQEEAYGKEFMTSVGYQPERRMGFLYLARRNEDGSVTLQSQSVDNSDQEAFKRAMQAPKSLRAMLDNYDQIIAAKYNTPVYAGKIGGYEYNAWSEMQKHHDLLDYYFSSLISLAAANLSSEDMMVAKQQLTYGTWAALQKRLRTQQITPLNEIFADNRPIISVQNEISLALLQSMKEGKVMVGCGGAIDLMSDGPQQAFENIFGGEKNNEAWSWKNGVCRVEKCPSRPKTTMVGPCSVCKRCQKLFDDGLDPTKGK